MAASALASISSSGAPSTDLASFAIKCPTTSLMASTAANISRHMAIISRSVSLIFSNSPSVAWTAPIMEAAGANYNAHALPPRARRDTFHPADPSRAGKLAPLPRCPLGGSGATFWGWFVIARMFIPYQRGPPRGAAPG